MNLQTKLKMDRLSLYLDRVQTALDHDNLPAAMADLAELGEQSRRMWNFLAELERARWAPKAKAK